MRGAKVTCPNCLGVKKVFINGRWQMCVRCGGKGEIDG